VSTRRVQKVSELLIQQLSELIRESISDEFGMITVTAVNVTDDLREAQVFFSCLDESKQKEALSALEAKKNEFQRVLGRRLSMKFTPKLSFKIDEGLEKVNRIEELLEGIVEK